MIRNIMKYDNFKTMFTVKKVLRRLLNVSKFNNNFSWGQSNKISPKFHGVALLQITSLYEYNSTA